MADYYISPTGNDSTGAGTSGNPWKTVDKAFTSSTLNDRIIHLPGTYAWVTPTNALLDRIITTTIPNDPSKVIYDAASAAVTWYIGRSAPSGTPSVTGITFQNADMTGAGAPCINLGNASLTIRNCVFNNNITDHLSSPNALMAGGSGLGGTIWFDRCLFLRNRCSAATNGYLTVLSGFNGTLLHTHVTFFQDCAANIGLIPSGVYHFNPTNIYKNSIYYTVNAVSFDNGATAPTGFTNIIYGFTGGTIPGGLTGTITSDPKFIDVINNNFALQPTSPGINAGVLL